MNLFELAKTFKNSSPSPPPSLEINKNASEINEKSNEKFEGKDKNGLESLSVPFHYDPNYSYSAPLELKDQLPKYSDSAFADFWCNSCEKGFNRKQKLDEHVGLHVKCDFEGCQFSAIPKYLDFHKENIHFNEKLQNLIKKLSLPEEIQKWREERIRKFPTKANIERKLKEEQERRDRGEIVDETAVNKGRTKRENNNNNQRDKRGNNRENKRDRNRNNREDRDAKRAKNNSQEEKKENITITTSESIDRTSVPMEDSEAPEEAKIEKKESGEEVETKPIEKKNELCRHFNRGKCFNGSNCKFVHDEEAKAAWLKESQQQKKEKRKEKETNRRERAQHTKPSTQWGARSL
eukprot:TRINITY_DN3482_c0_g1_i7.p1 TRINITY_DN3482_c0_g1~~TRINITY_DN3482_c0_g1_i7.p1  ORF type:complete len:350 (-),score=164.60 TRINITY_DN3482_c0_g1_i7:78-1127(-)